MSLVGYRAQNHPQQAEKSGPNDTVDDRGTAPADFAEFAAEFGPFTLDVAAAPHNAKCERYFTLQDDGLAQSWAGERVWCNPPYSDLASWVRKAWAEWSASRGIVLLAPANRCEQPWWQDYVEPARDRAGSPLRTTFLPRRRRFVKHGADTIRPNERPPFGCVLLAWKDPAA